MMTTLNMSPARSFAAVALAAVSWDGQLTMAGTRALRHSLDYREPFRSLDDPAMVTLLDQLLGDLRRLGSQHLMVEAAAQLTSEQRQTAYAVAVEIMRSDGPLQSDEVNILGNLAAVLALDSAVVDQIHQVMDILHAPVGASHDT
jgi:hypothetical protein